MTQIAILGAGYVGKAAAKSWHDRGFRLTLTTTNPDRIPELQPLANQVLLLHGHDTAAVRSLLQNHTTLLVSLGAKRGNSYTEVYLKTARSIAAVIDSAPSLQHIIYTSSLAVYGNHHGDWVTESSPLQPTNLNSSVLAETEQILLDLATPDRKVCILRLAGIYGPGRELERILQPLAGTTQGGDGSDVANWVHRDDVVGAITFAHNDRLQGIYNVVNDTPLSRSVILDWLCQKQGWEPVEWDPEQPNPRSTNMRLSNHKLKTAGYTFQHPKLITPHSNP
jgi:nucleoside-diphosphate-sugar epimerase